MISHVAPSQTALRPSRPSITVLRPSLPAEARSARAPEPRSSLPELRRSLPAQPAGTWFGDLYATLRMAVGLDDDHEDYECMR